jgi:hypothetical protein
LEAGENAANEEIFAEMRSYKLSHHIQSFRAKTSSKIRNKHLVKKDNMCSQDAKFEHELKKVIQDTIAYFYIKPKKRDESSESSKDGSPIKL